MADADMHAVMECCSMGIWHSTRLLMHMCNINIITFRLGAGERISLIKLNSESKLPFGR